MAQPGAVSTLERFDTFISYSRKDSTFVRTLDERLRSLQRKPWTDWESLPPGSEFPPRIKAGIDGAANFLFVISPDSVGSPWCLQELAYAVENRKRLISILYRPVDAEALPESIRTLDWIDFGGAGIDASLAVLVNILDTDQQWVDGHTRLLVRAKEWEAQANESFLLRGDELQEAVRWLGAAGPAKQPRPTPLQSEYIEASLAAQEQEKLRWQQLSEKFLAGRLSAESKLLLEESPRLAVRSALLAVESVRRYPSAEGHDALARVLSILPRPVRRIPSAEPVEFVSFSAAGSYLCIADRQGALTVVETGSYETAASFVYTGRLRTIAFSPAESLLAAGGDDGRAVVWDLETRQIRAQLVCEAPVAEIRFAPDGRLLSTSTGSATILWEAETGKRIGTIAGASASRFYGEGGTIITSEGAHLLIRDLATGSTAADLPHDSVITAFDVHPSAPVLAAATFDGRLWIWSQADGERIARDGVAGGISRVGPVVFSPDGQRIAAVGADSQVRVWDAAARTEIGRFRHKGLGLQLRFLSARLLASVSPEDESLVVWDVDTGKTALCLEQGDASSVAYDAKRELLAAVGVDGAAWVWARPTEGAWLWTADVGLPRRIFFSRDGSAVAWFGPPVAPDGKVAVKDGAVLTVLDSGTGMPMPHQEEARRLFDAMPAEIAEAAPAPDGKSVLILSDKKSGVERRAEAAELRSTEDNRLLGKLRFDGAITAVAWSPDSTLLATGHVDGIVRAWDAGAVREIARLEHHIEVVPALAFSPDGRLLASAGYDGRIVMWRARLDDIAAEVRARLVRGLTKEEEEKYLEP